MEYLEEYDDQCQALCSNIEKWFYDTKKKEIADADKQQLLKSILGKMEGLRETLTYFKSDLYLVPRAKEGEYRKKYETYTEKLIKYEQHVKKLELYLNKDTEGLQKLKHQFDEEAYAGKLNQETMLLAKQGFQTQDASKAAALRIQQRVGEIQDVQNEIQEEQSAQNEKLLKFHDHLGRIEGTLSRTKTRIQYFQKSFFRDKIAVTLLLLILLAIVGAVTVLILPGNDESSD